VYAKLCRALYISCFLISQKRNNLPHAVPLHVNRMSIKVRGIRNPKYIIQKPKKSFPPQKMVGLGVCACSM